MLRQGILKGKHYRIEGISETPDASADFYCQSNTNNHTRTSCAFYVKSLQVNHRQNTQKAPDVSDVLQGPAFGVSDQAGLCRLLLELAASLEDPGHVCKSAVGGMACGAGGSGATPGKA